MHEDNHNDIIKRMDRAMQILAIIVAVLLIVFMAASCGAVKLQTVHDTTEVVRTEYREILRDTTIYVQLPSESYSNVTKDTTSTIEGRTAVTTASISGGLLHHTLHTKDYQPEVVVQYKDRILTRDSIVTVDVYKEVPVQRDLNWYQRTWIVLGWCLIGIVIVVIIYYAIKIYMRGFRI